MRSKKRIIFSLILVIFLVVLFSAVLKNRQLWDNKSIDGLLQTVVRAYQNQDSRMLQFCYGKSSDKIKEDAQINFERKFFLSVNAEKVDVRGSEVLLEKSGFSYVGVYVGFIMGTGAGLPYYEYFIIQKMENGNYKAVTENDCPREVMDYFSENSEELETGSLFRSYENNEKSYVQFSPEYADKIYKKLLAVFDGMPAEVENNLRSLSIIFVMAILQLWILYTWVYLASGKKKRYTKQYFRNKIKGRKFGK